MTCQIPGSRETVRVGDRVSSALSGHRVSRWVTQGQVNRGCEARFGGRPVPFSAWNLLTDSLRRDKTGNGGRGLCLMGKGKILLNHFPKLSPWPCSGLQECPLLAYVGVGGCSMTQSEGLVSSTLNPF